MNLTERHRKWDVMISRKGIKHESSIGQNMYFIDCQHCEKRVIGKYDTIDAFYRHHVENYHAHA